MNYARLIEWRGKTALWLAEVLSRWSTSLRATATRDLPQAVRPDDLLNRGGAARKD